MGLLDEIKGKDTGVLQNLKEGVVQKDLADISKTKLIGSR